MSSRNDTVTANRLAGPNRDLFSLGIGCLSFPILLIALSLATYALGLMKNPDPRRFFFILSVVSMCLSIAFGWIYRDRRLSGARSLKYRKTIRLGNVGTCVVCGREPACFTETFLVGAPVYERKTTDQFRYAAGFCMKCLDSRTKRGRYLYD